MSLRFPKLFLLLALLHHSQTLSSQVIWLEDFSGAPPAPGWVDNFTDCDGTAGSFNGVANNRYEIIDMEGAPCCPVATGVGGGNDNEWVTNEINIAGFCNVTVSVDYGFNGTFECIAGGPFFGCQGADNIDNGHDQMVFEYSLDGGGFIQFQYVCGGAAGLATVNGLTGNTIRVRVRAANKAVAETYWFDNVQVSGTQPTVDPEPDVNGCAGSPISVTFSGSGTPPPTFSWTNDNTAIGLAASGTGNINFTPPSSITSQEVANITVTPTSGGCSGTPEMFTITVNPLPLTNDPPDIVACSGDFVEVIFSGSDPNATYHWTVTNVPLFPPSGQGDISGTVPPLPFSLNGTVTVHAESNGCVGPNQSFNVSLFPAISADFSMVTPADLCAGQPATFSVNFSGGAPPYTFTYAIDGVNQPPLTTNNDPFNFNLSLASGATISGVSFTSGNGCDQDVSGSFNVNVVPTPTATLAPGPSNLCEGSELNLQITFNGSELYNFVYTINGVPQPSETATGPNATLTLTPPAGTTTYALTMVNSQGCTGTASGTHVATVIPPPTAFINGNPVICAGQNASVSVTLSGSAPWTFVYSIDGNEEPPVTTSNSPYIINASYNATTTLELVSVATGNCPGTANGLAVVTVQPGITGMLASDTSAVCIGQSDTLNFSFAGATPYTFIYAINGTPQPSITTDSTSYQIVVTPAVTSTYTLTSVSNSNCPGGSASGTYQLNVTDPPTATLMGNDTICAEHSTSLSVSFTGAAPWTFSYAANGIPKDTITTSSNPFSLSVSPTATTTYSLTGVSSGSCAGSVSGTATVRVIPNPTATISGGGQICQNGSGTNIVFTFTGTAPWTVKYKANNDTITATSTTSPLVVPVNPNVGTIYSLIEISDSLCVDTAKGTVVVFVFTPATAQFLGSASFCDTASTQVSIDFTGTGPFTIGYTINGVAQQPDTTFDDPYILPVNVNTTTTYTLTSIQSPGCNGIITGNSAVITVNYAPTYANVELNCNPANSTYVVSFDVLGASLPLTSVAGNSGSFSGTKWTSNPIPQSMGYSFTFHDANNCGNVTVSGQSTCNCTTEAGNMNLTPIEACRTQVINAAYNGGFVNDGNDTLLYILHENPALPVGTVYGWSATPSFGFLPGMSTGKTYYISAIAGNISNGLVDTTDLCTVVSQGTPVLFHALPVGDLGISSPEVCLGDSLTLNINFTGVAPFSFTPEIGGVVQTPITGIASSPYSWTITPSASVVVELDNVADNHCPTGQPMGGANISVNTGPVIDSIRTQCDYGTATYTVTFDILSGTPPYSVNGLAGFFSGSSFTSIPIPFASNTFFATISDANQCGQDTISGESNCDCLSFAGTMNPDTVFVCQSDTLHVLPSLMPVLDIDDTLMYVLHTTPGNNPIGLILDWSATPDFTFGGAMQTGVTYYVSAIVGNPDGNGMIDLLDPCLSVATGTPVQWLATPTATLASATFDVCPEEEVMFLITFTGTAPFMLDYTNNNSPATATANQSLYLIKVKLQDTAVFVLTNVTDANCPGPASGMATVNVHPPSLAANFTTTCSIADQTYTVEFDVTQGDFMTTTIGGMTGIFDPATGHFTSNPIPITQQPYNVSVSDSWDCGAFMFSDSVDCVCETQAGVMDQSVLTLCNGQTATVSPAAGSILEFDDELLYFLVGQSPTPPNWTIVGVNAAPTFSFNPATMTPSTPYYIVAVAGNVGGANGIDLSDECLSISPGATVSWRPPVTAALSGDSQVCPGTPATINVQFSGDGPFNFTYTDGTTPQSLSNISQNPYAILVNPATTTGYNLVNVSGAGNCPGTISGGATVTVSNPPQVLNLMVNCDLSTETYTLSFDIGNGAQPNPVYTILGLQGTLTDTTFTSIAYPGAQPYAVVIGNPTGCTTSISGMPNCVCATDAGTLGNPVNGCLPVGTVSAQATGNANLDANDLLNYVLCSDPAALPNGILATNSLPEFGFQTGMTAGITYYIVAVAGNNLNGMVDMGDPCLSFSPGVPVVFNFPPSALITGDLSLCKGQNGTFQVQLSGVEPFKFVYAINGVPQMEVSTPLTSFNILSNNVQQNQVFTLVSVSDANCPGTVDGQATLNVVPPPTASILSNTILCIGDTATLNIDVNGGTSYNISISGGIQLNGVQNDTTLQVSPSVTTTYTVTNLVASGNMCPFAPGQSATVTVSSMNLTGDLSDYNGFNTSCPLSTDGNISVTPSGGIAPISATWSNGVAGFDNNNIGAGNYAVTLTDQAGCTFTDSFEVVAPPELDIQFAAESPTCFGDRDGSLSITNVLGGAGPFALTVNGDALPVTNTFPVDIPSLTSGVYTIEVEDANGCVSDTDATVPAPLELTVNLGPDTTIHFGDSLLLTAALNFGDVESFSWSNTEYMRNPDSLVTVILPFNTVRYGITVTSSEGCEVRDEVTIYVNKDRRVYIPNVITPDLDSFDDVLTVYGGSEVRQVRFLRIYDRWGDMLFENENFLPGDEQAGWNGEARGQKVNPGVFVYVVEVEYINGRTEIIAGDVTVVR